MELLKVFPDWWYLIKILLVALLALIWAVVTPKRRAKTEQPVITQEDVTASPPDVRQEKQVETVGARHSDTKEKLKKHSKAPKKFTRTIPNQTVAVQSGEQVSLESHPEIHIFYASQYKHTPDLAKHLLTLVSEYSRVHDLSVIPNLDDYFLQHPSNAFYFILVPSYANDSGPTQTLIEALEETLNDFRVDANPLQKLAGFAVFGTGDKEGWPMKHEFCYQAQKVQTLMEQLGAKRTFALGTGDAKGRTSLESQIDGWAKRVLQSIQQPNITPSASIPEQSESLSDSEPEEDTEETPILDVEDIGPVAKRHTSSTTQDFTPKPMVSKTSATHSALTKQGYTIVGTHSGVKICRWTKSALRGRGSCYKFSFYGIKSHLCMETTPSLACANKCVFCWRHGTNPVGTTWRWQVDPPEEVYKGALEGHYAKINMLKGMMGVRPERYEEAKRVRHCALSLVGEPIFCMSPSSLGCIVNA